MRITNPMMTNRMLLNMTRNAINVDNLYNQIATGKKIAFPSDNPILASRALKFRTNVSETEQYMKNVAQGLSWMEVSEAAFKNIQNIMDKIRDLAERGSTGTLTFEDRQKIITEIASLADQIGLEMNATYAGRYIFSGYRTDEPPTITEDAPAMRFEITQYFAIEDIEHTKAYTQLLPPAYNSGDSTVKDVQVIKLAYPVKNDPPEINFISPAIAAANIVSIKDQNAYEPGNFIVETGEYVISVAKRVDGADTPAGLRLMNFSDDNIAGILGLNDPAVLTALETELGVAGAADVIDALDGSTLDSINNLYDTLGLAAVKIPAVYNATVALPDSMVYEKTGFIKGELNPKVYFNCVDLDDPTKRYNAEFVPPNVKRQELELEFSIGTRVKINSHAADIYSDKMYGDLQALVQSVMYVNGKTKDQIRTELEMYGNLSGEELEDHLALETQKIQDAIQSRLRDMIGLADLHMNRISREHTDMGTRMSRLELIESRLSDDRVSYSKLLSENEDVDYMEAMMNYNIAESIYQASLRVGANIMKITLADYI